MKRDDKYEKRKKRVLCRKRAAIEPIIGHLKQNYRLLRNWLKGSCGDKINLLMAACEWNMKKRIITFFLLKIYRRLYCILIVVYENYVKLHFKFIEKNAFFRTATYTRHKISIHTLSFWCIRHETGN